MREIYCGLSCNLDANILNAALPLFESGEVDAIEWSFDTLFAHSGMPDWFDQLLQYYGQEGRLIGHGVYYSLFSGAWTEDQAQWLIHLKETCQKYRFDHITEHFGYMTGSDFHKGAPLSVPLHDESLRVAHDRIKRMSAASQLPVGLENLAFAYSQNEITDQLRFLGAVIQPVNGFVILDLHNIYCQVQNFQIPFKTMMKDFPLDKVREIHISGGSWESSNQDPSKMIRRDTHDDRVPSEVFDYLEYILSKAPNLKFVILESLGVGLTNDMSKTGFRNDFNKMKTICKNSQSPLSTKENDFISDVFSLAESPLVSIQLAAQQASLSNILELSNDFNEVKDKLAHSNLSNTAWKIEKWDDLMIETAFEIAQKWEKGF